MAAKEVLVESAAESAAESAESPLELLPDDAVLAVLEHLSIAQLLGLRAVCRRLHRLALHPELWRQRRLERQRGSGLWVGQLRAPLLRALLHFAPCGASLYLDSGLDRLGAAVASTSCAVAEFSVGVKANSDAILATLAIRNQAGLGRLRTVCVCLEELADKAATCPAVVGLLAELHRTKLTSLTVQWGETAVTLPGWADSAVPAEPGAASLESLCYQSTELYPHAVFLLRSHAATLTTVTLLDVCQPPGALGELLGEARGLRSLKCPMPEDMRPLLQCRQLRELELYPGSSAETGLAVPYSPAAVEHGKAFFREATHLRQLTLIEWQQGDSGPLAASLVGALASSGRAKLRTLALRDWEDGCRAQEGIGGSYSADDFRTMNVPGLPALWEILFKYPEEDGISELPVALLEVLATQTVPSLHVVEGMSACCLNLLLHEPALRAAIRRNPSLHVLTVELGCGYDVNGRVCVACEPDGCGDDPNICGIRGICGHPEADDAKCGVDEHTDELWVRVDEEEHA